MNVSEAGGVRVASPAAAAAADPLEAVAAATAGRGPASPAVVAPGPLPREKTDPWRELFGVSLTELSTLGKGVPEGCGGAVRGGMDRVAFFLLAPPQHPPSLPLPPQHPPPPAASFLPFGSSRVREDDVRDEDTRDASVVQKRVDIGSDWHWRQVPGLPVHPPCWSTGRIEGSLAESRREVPPFIAGRRLSVTALLWRLFDTEPRSLNDIGGSESVTMSASDEASCAADSAQRHGVPSEQKPQRSTGVFALFWESMPGPESSISESSEEEDLDRDCDRNCGGGSGGRSIDVRLLVVG